MKYNQKILVSAIFILLFSGIVSAVSFSPSSLVYNLEPNEKGCQKVSLSSESDTISVSDFWAENTDMDWNVNNFQTSGSSHGISIERPSKLTSEREFEVCVSGSNKGEYHGVLLMKEEQSGNSIIQVGIWIKLIVGNQPAPKSSTSTTKTTTTSGGNAGNQIQNLTDKNIQKNLEQENSTTVIDEKGITGLSIFGDFGKNLNWKLSILVVIILFILVIIFYVRKYYKNKKRYSYG